MPLFPFQKSSQKRYHITSKKTLHCTIKPTELKISELPLSLCSKDILTRYEYLGQYGNIISLSFSPSTDVYVAFSMESEAAIALLSLKDTNIYNTPLSVTYRTSFTKKGTKYTIDSSFNDISFAIDKSRLNEEEVKKKFFTQCANKRTIFPSPADCIRKYERKNEGSRFGFGKGSHGEIDVPKFVTDIVNRRYMMERLVNCERQKIDSILCDDLFNGGSEEEMNWAEFIVLNLNGSCNNDRELISDIDNINKYIYEQIAREG